MGIGKAEMNFRRLLAATPQQQNQAKLIHYVATLREQLEQIAEETTPQGLPRVSKAQVDAYSEMIEALASKLVSLLPDTEISDFVKRNSFKESLFKTDGETATPLSLGLRRRIAFADRSLERLEVDTSEPVINVATQPRIENHRKLQENLTDEMIRLVEQLKGNSLMISQSLRNTEKVLHSTEKAIEQSLASTSHANVQAMKICTKSSKTACFTWLLICAMTCSFLMIVHLICVVLIIRLTPHGYFS